ncbi:MAG: ribbon-helix-helix domain-containing protein [Fervidicoccaceae archaeon]
MYRFNGIVTVKLPGELKELLIMACREDGYRSISRCLRDIIREYIRKKIPDDKIPDVIKDAQKYEVDVVVI